MYILKEKGIDRGFIYFDNDKIIDTGKEADPIYELSELVIDYEYKALAIHGYSVLTSLSEYPYRGLGVKADLSIFTRDELKKIINAALYELIMNGVTFPLIYDEYIDLVIKILKEHNLKAGIIAEEGTVPEYTGLYYIHIRGDNLYYNDEKLGSIKDAICSPEKINSNCLFLDLRNYYTYNLSYIMNILVKSLKNMFSALEIFAKPYKLIRIDKGYIDKQAKPDIVIYDLREPYLVAPRNHVLLSVLRGYVPSQVFINGDTFFDHGESLVLGKTRIDFILEK
ncbi:hypothetical protein [Staphylothermus hellenicus]|uniref:hypothetical protein n=1 Tax=Staphylothermus hellenicus TaxID=84599 RepID=UPI001FE0D5E5|nr:hypothetical protein [Staphylothermus hellenicus]